MARTCVKCRIEKPDDQFSKSDFSGRRCRNCRNVYMRERARDIREGVWAPNSKGRVVIYDATPRSIRQPTYGDLCWAAGFLEGEGTFRATQYSQSITCPQKDMECLDRLKGLFGGTIAARIIRDRPINTWEMHGARARGLMMTLFTLLSSRRQEQIRAALSSSLRT